jgi:hypothetical protein
MRICGLIETVTVLLSAAAAAVFTAEKKEGAVARALSTFEERTAYAQVALWCQFVESLRSAPGPWTDQT